ncbi:MAG: prepilin-type N-terminal cleavage/methylation domain-containing protein [Phycisphaeraceae bacterium]
MRSNVGPPPTLTHHAFTSIELLVVIAIIGVVIAITLPALGAARQATHAVVCASNLRQLTLANLAYAHDNNQHLVPGAPNFLDNLRRWHGERDTTNQPFDPGRSPLLPYFQTSAIKECPAFDTPRPGFESGNGGYGYNQRYLGTDNPDNLRSESSARLHHAKDPTNTLHFADTAFSTDGVEIIEYSFAEPPSHGQGFPASPSIHFRHHHTTNAAWLDGHVNPQTLNFTRASIYGVSQTTNQQLSLGWFGPDNNTLFDLE